MSVDCTYNGSFIVLCQKYRTHHLAISYKNSLEELAWRSGSEMDCHATTRGSIPGGKGVFTKPHILHKGQ